MGLLHRLARALWSPKPATVVEDFQRRLWNVSAAAPTTAEMYLALEVLETLTFERFHGAIAYNIARVTRITTVDNLILALTSCATHIEQRERPNMTGLFYASKLRLLPDILQTNKHYPVPPVDAARLVAERTLPILRALDTMFLDENTIVANRLSRDCELHFREVLQFTRLMVEASDQYQGRKVYS